MKDVRKGRRAAAIIITALVTVIVLLLNVIASVLNERLGLEADFSQESYYTITDDTVELLNNLQDDVYIYTLYSTGGVDEMIYGLLKNYERASDRVHLENIDPALNPTFTQPYDPEGKGIATGSLIVSDKAAKNYKVLTVYDLYAIESNYNLPFALQAEQKVTSTINYLTTGEIPAVKLLSGHNETPLEEMTELTSALRALNYDIGLYDSTLNGTELDPIYDILLVVSPREDLSGEEYEKIKAFLDAGGNAAFLLDRVVLNEANGTNYIVGDELNNFNALLMLYDIHLNNDYIIGGNSDKLVDKVTAHIPDMYAHAAITADMITAGRNPVLSDVSSLTLSGDGSRSAILLATDANTWAKDLTGTVVNMEKQAGDADGPFTVGAVGMMGESNVAVYGTSSFVTDSEMQRAANRDLIINTVNSLKKSGDAFNIPAKSLIPGMMEVTSDAQKTGLTALVMIIIPVGILAAGFVIWIRRRRR